MSTTEVAPAKTIDLKPEDPLQAAAKHVRAEHQAIAMAVKNVVVRAMNLGDFLRQKKDELGHGRFIPWVETDCEVDIRQVQRYMKVAEGRAVIEKYNAEISKYDPKSYLTLGGALRLIARDKPDPPTPAIKYENAEKRLLGLLDSLPSDQVEDHAGATINALKEALAKKAKPDLKVVST
jgi:hypothetical protein